MIPATKESLSEKVYQGLIDLIITGELKPGDMLTERLVAEHLDASRTPVREAFARLESEGLVHKQANRGVKVSPFSSETLLHILDIRQLLEANAARLAAGKLTPVQLAGIRARIDAVNSLHSPTLQEIWHADDLLHSAIANAAGNPVMATIIRDLRRRTHVLNSYVHSLSVEGPRDTHQALIKALEAGDGEKAYQAMVEHIDDVKRLLLKRFSLSRLG